jgi:polygalacturonase
MRLTIWIDKTILCALIILFCTLCGVGISNLHAHTGILKVEMDAGEGLCFPTMAVVDYEGNLYVADSCANIVYRKHASGNIEIVAGNGRQGYSGDGLMGFDAMLDAPSGIATDNQGNLYIADSNNNRIRRIDRISQRIGTVAGTGKRRFGGDNGPAIDADLNKPVAMALDQYGNIYIADRDNHRIRRISKSTGTIETIVGNGISGFCGDGGIGTKCKLNHPSGVALDSIGNIYIADSGNHCIRFVDIKTKIIRTIAGERIAGFNEEDRSGIRSLLNEPTGLVYRGSGHLVIADSGNKRIREINISTGMLHTYGSFGSGEYNIKSKASSRLTFGSIYGIGCDQDGTILVADGLASRIMRLDPDIDVVWIPASNGKKDVGQSILIPNILKRTINETTINVINFGARGDGIADDTEAFQMAARAAEGKVLFVPKNAQSYLISNTIEIGSGTLVRIHGTVKLKDGVGVPIFRNSMPQKGHESLVLPATVLYTQRDIVFEGDGIGVLDGNGEKQKRKQGETCFIGAMDPYCRASAITMISVDNLQIHGLMIKNPAEWALRLRNCNHAVVSGNKILSGYGNGMVGDGINGNANGMNQDGIHLENTSNSFIAYNEIISSDDGIAVTAIARAENILIADNTIEARTLESGKRVDGSVFYMAAECIRIMRRHGSGEVGILLRGNSMLENIGIYNNSCRGYKGKEGGRGLIIGDYPDGAPWSPLYNEKVVKNIKIINNKFSQFLDTRFVANVKTGMGVFGEVILIAASEEIEFAHNIIENYARQAIHIVNSKKINISNNHFGKAKSYYPNDTSVIYTSNCHGDVFDFKIDANLFSGSLHGGISIHNDQNPAYQIGNGYISNNIFYVENDNDAKNSGNRYAIHASWNGAGGPPGSIEIVDNAISEKYLVGIELKNWKNTTIKGNTVFGLSASELDHARSVNSYGNR